MKEFILINSCLLKDINIGAHSIHPICSQGSRVPSLASHRGKNVIIVGEGGGETDGGDPVTEGYRAGQLDDGKVIFM